MSQVVTGRFGDLIQAEEAISESLLRFPREDVALVAPPLLSQGSAFVVIRTADHADRRLAVRTLQGRGAVEIEVRVDAVPTYRARTGTGRAAALA